jgi:flagellin-like protein
MMEKFLRNKRAFSPVIAALILMLIAVAAGVVVYGYVMGWLGGATSVPPGTKGELQFDSLYATAGSPGTITIYVRNVGQKELTLSMVYVNGENKTSTITDDTLSVGEVSEEITASYSMTAGLTYEVKVTCTDGTTVTQSVEARG